MRLTLSNLRKMANFAVAGGLNTVFGLLIYAGLVLLGFPVWLTVTLSMLGALVFNYLTYGGIVFKDLSWRTFPRFVAFYVFLAGLNTVLLHVMTGLALGPLLSQTVLALPLAVTSYIGLTVLVFPEPKESAGCRRESER